MTWDALRKSLNGLVNKVNIMNVKQILPEFFGEVRNAFVRQRYPWSVFVVFPTQAAARRIGRPTWCAAAPLPISPDALANG